MESSALFMESKNMACASFSSGEAHMTDKPGTSFSRGADSPEDTKLAGDVSGATASIDRKPKFMQRAKTWSDEVENLYRFQQAGYRDENEYKQVKHVDVVERWPETGFVKKLQRRDNTFYYYDKERECEDKEVHNVKMHFLTQLGNNLSAQFKEHQGPSSDQIKDEEEMVLPFTPFFNCPGFSRGIIITWSSTLKMRLFHYPGGLYLTQMGEAHRQRPFVQEETVVPRLRFAYVQISLTCLQLSEVFDAHKGSKRRERDLQVERWPF